MRSTQILCLVVGAAYAASTSALARPGDGTTDAGAAPQDLASAIAALDAPTFDERDVAEEWLAARPSIRLADLFESLTRETLSPEQRARLVRVARLKFLARDPAGLGVEFDQMAQSDGVFIQRTIAGFASAEFLKPQDEIRSVDGLTVWERDQVRAGIISHDPGEIIEIGVMREGRPLIFKITLGSFSSLKNNGGPREADVIEQAWALRVAREFRRVHRDDPSLADRLRLALVPEVGAERWDRLDAQLDRARRLTAQAGEARGPARVALPDVIVGGEPRGGLRHEISDRMFPIQGVRITPQADIRRQKIQAELNQIDREKAELNQLQFIILQNEQKLERGDTPAATRERLVKTIEEAKARAVMLENSIEKRRDALAESE